MENAGKIIEMNGRDYEVVYRPLPTRSETECMRRAAGITLVVFGIAYGLIAVIGVYILCRTYLC